MPVETWSPPHEMIVKSLLTGLSLSVVPAKEVEDALLFAVR